MTFSRNLLILRKKKLLTQEQLGKAIGASKQMISNWERGDNMASQKYLDLLAKVLGVEVSDLYKENLTSEPKPDKKEGLDYMNVAIQSLLMTVDSMKQDIKRLEQEVRELRLAGNGQKQGRN